MLLTVGRLRANLLEALRVEAAVHNQRTTAPSNRLATPRHVHRRLVLHWSRLSRLLLLRLLLLHNLLLLLLDHLGLLRLHRLLLDDRHLGNATVKPLTHLIHRRHLKAKLLGKHTHSLHTGLLTKSGDLLGDGGTGSDGHDGLFVRLVKVRGYR